jgi:hypothetical protein
VVILFADLVEAVTGREPVKRPPKLDNKVRIKSGGLLVVEEAAGRLFPGMMPRSESKLPNRASGLADIGTAVAGSEIKVSEDLVNKQDRGARYLKSPLAVSSVQTSRRSTGCVRGRFRETELYL